MSFRSFTRRDVLKGGAAASVGLALGKRAMADLRPGASVADARLKQLEYSQVTLLPGPMRTQFEQTQARFLGLDNDMLLKPFRQGAGMDAPGDDMGGWYSNSRFWATNGGAEGFVAGHSFGQYVSALSRGYAATGDRATKVKVEQLVAGLQPTLVSKFYDGYHLPGYTFDKTFCGLSDACYLAGVESAKPLMRVALDAALPHLPEKALSRMEQHARPHKIDGDTWDETYTLPENLFLAYQRTGDARYRDVAQRFLEDDLLFNPLAEDINVLPGEHAYSHVNSLSSAMQAYLTTGSEKHLRAATNGFRIVQEQSFATGGWGPGESLLRPHTDDLARSIFSEKNSFETPCGAYGHFKITRYLLRVTGDSRYGDTMERVLYNTVLGVKPILEDGSSFYYSDYSTNGRKLYYGNKWPCCSGTLPQIAADYGISSYFASDAGLHVNLFVPSKVTWTQGGAPVTLTQETQYPFRPTTKMTLKLAAEREFALNVRIPEWAGPGTRVTVNGKAVEGEVRPGTFHSVKRGWRDGDVVEIEFGIPVRLETISMNLAQPSSTQQASSQATAEFAAVMSGPVVYMATGHWPTEMIRSELMAAKKVESGDALVVEAEKAAVVFRPFTAIGDEMYRTYQPLKG
jgi:DUF1680 family protein